MNLLVVVHEATRTGAPLVLLELLRHLRATTDVAVGLEVLVGGSLAGELAAVDDGVDRATADAVLVNSAIAAGAVLDLPPGVPTALYVHEDGPTVAALPAQHLAAVARYDLVLCVSDEILEALVQLGVERSRVSVLPPVVRPAGPVDDDALARARTGLGAGPGEAVVLGCGEGSWRKGADLFVAVAGRLADVPGLRFAWLGLRPRPFARLLDHDVASLGLADRFRWLGEVADTGPYLAAASVLVLTSRYDPQPLVAIEAATVGTPTVGFEVGGIGELAADGGALAVPYPDVPALADLVGAVVGDPVAAAALVDAARSRWQRRQTVEVVGPRFVAAVESLPGLVPR